VQLFLAFVVALSITAALIPLLVRWAPTIGLTDAPGPRKVHSIPVPRVGGLAMAVGLLLPTLITVELTPSLRGVLLGLVVLLVFGVWDDKVNLGYRTKFAGQVLAVGLCMIVGKVHIGTLMIGSVIVLPQAVSILITFVFLIGVTNAVNLADGLDGLAGGMVLLCLCAIALFAAMSGNGTVVKVALIEAGAILGFLRFNTHPARIFMGDSGSQMLGFSVGTLALLATQGETCPLSAALPLLLLGLPIMDTLTVMFTRIRAGRSPFSADSNHLHHRLLALGFAHREAVLLVYLIQVGLVLLAYSLRFNSDSEVFVAFCVVASLVIGLVHRASQVGWRLSHLGQKSGSLRLYINGFTPAARIPALALGVMATCLALYATTVLASRRHVEVDLGMMCLAMLIVLLLLSWWKAQRSLQWFERASAYISVVLLVYLDQTMPYKPPPLTTLSWTFVGITGAAALVRFWLSPTRRFELTTLDLIVLFLALVLPNLPGSIALPADLPGGIAKTVILLYVVEMLLTIDLQRLVPRLFLGVTLAVIAGRALIGIST
jgi:UDP-GlcNAc:undecaprenyl-phosphate/decaprenyl-phosphate GlcNAc-1-phosphate transferase